MPHLRVLLRTLAWAFAISVAAALAHGVAMLFRAPMRAQLVANSPLWIFARVVLAEAGLLAAMLGVLGLPIAAAGVAGYRRGAVWTAVGVQMLVLTAFAIYCTLSFSHYRATGGFLLTGDLVLLSRDFGHVAREVKEAFAQFLVLVGAAIGGACCAVWPVGRLARACVDLRATPLGRRTLIGSLGFLGVTTVAAAELATAHTGAFARVARFATPELAILHEWALESRAAAAVPIVMPEDLSLLRTTPMAAYLRGAAPPPDAPRWNVVVLMLESVPAGHTTPYGYARRTTPNLERIAGESLVFDHTVASASSSSYAQLAALSSLYPLKYYVRDEYQKLNYPRTLIWDVLQPLGYTTAAISSQDERWNNMIHFLKTKRLGTLFHSPLFDGPKVDHLERVQKIADHYTVGRVIDWLDHERKEPFALYVNLQGTHHPYLVVPECPGPFQPAKIDFPFPYLHWPREKAGVVGNAFDNALYCVDVQVGRVERALAERGLLDRTILAISADHGEGFYEHDAPNHGYSLYEEQLRVPWLLRVPGLAPGRFAPTVSQLDILPTVLGRLGFRAVHPNFQGVDVLRPGYTDRGRDFFASVQYGRNLTSLVRDGAKLIRNIGTGLEEFYDLRLDPGEQHPSSSDPRIEDLRRRLLTMVQRQLTYYADDALASSYYPPPLLTDMPLRHWRPVGPRLDFENGGWGPDWEAHGDAFGAGPATAAQLGIFKKQSGFRGRYFATSLREQGDAARGELLSRPFPLVGERMQILLGGGDERGVGAALLVDGRAVRQASGQGADGFNPVWWDLAGLRGKTARVRVFDESTRPMGHVLIDDIRQYVEDRSNGSGD